MPSLPPDSADALAARIDLLTKQCRDLDADSAQLAIDLRDAVEAFHCTALHDLIEQLTRHPAAREALRNASIQPSVYTLLRRHALIKPSQHEQVLSALEYIRPDLQQHGGDIRLVAIHEGLVTLELLGACDGCGSSSITITEGIEKTLYAHCHWLTDIDVLTSSTANDNEKWQPVRIISPFEVHRSTLSDGHGEKT